MKDINQKGFHSLQTGTQSQRKRVAILTEQSRTVSIPFKRERISKGLTTSKRRSAVE